MNCNTCHIRINDFCPFTNVPEEELIIRCPLLRRQFQDNVLKTFNKSVKNDYSRNDTGDIAADFNPNLN
jgi:hypothetical protein